MLAKLGSLVAMNFHGLDADDEDDVVVDDAIVAVDDVVDVEDIGPLLTLDGVVVSTFRQKY